ncbi:MAG: hypothetical protein AAB036_04270 [Elusimicrobiota bacterium]
METIIAVCLVLIVLELALMIGVFALVMLKVKNAAQAVEVAAYRVDEEVLSFGQSLRSGWGETMRTCLSAALAIFRR